MDGSVKVEQKLPGILYHLFLLGQLFLQPSHDTLMGVNKLGLMAPLDQQSFELLVLALADKALVKGRVDRANGPIGIPSTPSTLAPARVLIEALPHMVVNTDLP